ncbi:hypothetical protein Tco_0649641 [Tanacetum coccineum]
MIQTSPWRNASDENDCFTNFETEFPAIVFDDTLTSDIALSCESTVSPLNKNEFDFRISFDESDDEDYMAIFDENSFSYKIISVDDLKTDLKKDNDKIDMPSSPEPTISHSDDLDFFKDFENEFPAITYNDDLMSKLTEPSSPGSNAINIYTKGSNKLLKTGHDMEHLPPKDHRHLWLRYQVKGYTKDIVHNYEQRLETIFSRSVNQVHVLDFARLIEGRRQNLAGRLRRVYTGDEGQELMSDTEMGLDVADTLCFYFGGVRCKMTWRQFIMALGLYTVEEMAEDGFGAYWRQAPEKVTGVNIFYLRSMDQGTAKVPYLLAKYVFRHAEGEESAEDAPAVDDGAQANPTLVQAPQPPPTALKTMSQRITRLKEEVQELRQSIVGLRGDVDRSITDQGWFTTWMVSCMTQLMDASCRTYQAFDNTLVGILQLPY